MKRVLLFLLVIGIGGLWTCTTDNDVVFPALQPPLVGITDVAEANKPIMDGVYTVTNGIERFGFEVVVKWTGKRLSIFSLTNYAILQCGYKDSVVYMRGYWRVPTSDGTGLIDMVILKVEGAREIVKGAPTTSIVIRGKYGNQNGLPDINVTFRYKRPFSSKVTGQDFYIIGHRAGGRTSDRLPVSENSIPMIKHTGSLGSNGIEIDIRLTKDKVPVLYHDPDINIRLTVKGPLNGPIGNFTLNQLSAFVRLIRGEKIPTLDEALRYVVDSTNLKFVWLDMKDEDPDLVKYVLPVQIAAITRAQAAGRNVEFLMGIPSKELFDALKATPGYQLVPSLCEISPETTRELGSKAWAPRWTLGTQNSAVTSMQVEGRRVYTWTIDLPAYIRQFINEGKFNGFLSNYPSHVAYFFYIQE
ncbi:MAG: glycerophosphodiester phosphodiesterase family protein [Cytophagales bacterium]|nr:glycerophosphodiester phosphodiesterase family protein [Cytophagales bacterium]